MSRRRDQYLGEVVPALKKEFSYTNVMAIPKILKIIVNMVELILIGMCLKKI